MFFRYCAVPSWNISQFPHNFIVVVGGEGISIFWCKQQLAVRSEGSRETHVAQVATASVAGLFNFICACSEKLNENRKLCVSIALLHLNVKSYMHFIRAQAIDCQMHRELGREKWMKKAPTFTMRLSSSSAKNLLQTTRGPGHLPVPSRRELPTELTWFLTDSWKPYLQQSEFSITRHNFWKFINRDFTFTLISAWKLKCDFWVGSVYATTERIQGRSARGQRHCILGRLIGRGGQVTCSLSLGRC